MKSLQDALYNWLTIQVVADARPEDHAAQDTAQLFKNILKIDFQIEKVAFVKEEENVHCELPKRRKRASHTVSGRIH